MNAHRIILIVILFLVFLLAASAPVSAHSPSGPTSASPAEQLSAPAQPEPARHTLASDPAALLVVGLVTVLFGAIAVLPLFSGMNEGCVRERY